jgi:uncharacterized protein YndB with AHSA1/START domain
MHAQMATSEKKYKATIDILSDTQIRITRTLDAPRELVFEAITQPEHVRRWYGCEVMQMTVCEIDLRVGGKWRYVLRMPDGTEHGFSGEYQEIVSPERIVSTESYEPIGPGHEMIARVTLEERKERTLFSNLLTYKSKADRDGHLGSGMEGGMNESFDRLDALVSRMR